MSAIKPVNTIIPILTLCRKLEGRTDARLKTQLDITDLCDGQMNSKSFFMTKLSKLWPIYAGFTCAGIV